jgi:hypothetical protein
MANKAKQKVLWCDRAVEWTVVMVDDERGELNAMWSYRLGGITYIGFPFDPGEEGLETRTRAVTWLNRHHFLLKRENLATDR